MADKLFTPILAAALFLMILASPGAAVALDLIVEHDPAGENHFPTIQQAIDHADRELRAAVTPISFRILVKADQDPYPGPITPISNVPIIGESTAGTFIEGGAETLISLNNVSGVTIRNFTFRGPSRAISVANSSTVTISNNVFHLGLPRVAIQVQNSPATSIINNTFYNNGTAIGTNSDILITNNIFSTNTTAISAQAALTRLSYSFFFNNQANGVVNLGTGSIPDPPRSFSSDPLFVDPADGDFHLQADSPARNKGNPNYPNSFDRNTFDMGAYGGPDSDVAPLAVTGLTSTVTGSTITLNWNPTSSAGVTAYRVYYGTSPLYDGSGSPITVPVTTTTVTLPEVPVTPPAPPSAPGSLLLFPRNRALLVTWSAVPGATGYRVYYSADETTLGAATPIEVDGESNTSVQIENLQNGTTYFVAVSAVARAQVFLAVTAVIDSGIAPAPGSRNESPYATAVQGVGDTAESSRSVIRSDFPEGITAFPNLSSKGCFIATAAFGFYSAPQVQLLRQFRDRYLMPHEPGRNFVAWYYRHGPRWARYMEAHPWLKLPVRIALSPVIAVAAFLLKTTVPVKIAIILLPLLVLWCRFGRRNTSPDTAGPYAPAEDATRSQAPAWER